MKHYITPRRTSGRHVVYDAKAFFESWYRATGECSDAGTIAADRSAVETRYHYNAVENSIIECLAGKKIPRPLTVLDIGSGAGHWIDFYRDVFQAEAVVGNEIAETAAASLREKYGNEGVRIVQADISDPGFRLDERFGIINAIGVMFHIVDDERWRVAVTNLARHLQPDGFVVISGQFGLTTQNVQFHRTDAFETWEEFRRARAPDALVNKRIRSRRRWRDCARDAGLRIECLKRTRDDRRIATPENNVLVLARQR